MPISFEANSALRTYPFTTVSSPPLICSDTLNGGNCQPLTSEGGKPYYPCGLIANSVFNGMSQLNRTEDITADCQTRSLKLCFSTLQVRIGRLVRKRDQPLMLLRR